jgi:hypothetical protein
MPAYGVSTKVVSEGRVQLLVGALIIASFATLYFGKNLANVPTPFGVELGDAMNLIFDALWFALIVWVTASPPVGGNVWVSAAYVITFPLMHLLINKQTHPPLAVLMCDVLIVGAGTAGGLSIIARRLWGAK